MTELQDGDKDVKQRSDRTIELGSGSSKQWMISRSAWHFNN
jgi:hypothetical protein